MKGALVCFVASFVISGGWIVFANLIGLDTFTRAWWAGSFSGSLDTLGLVFLAREWARARPTRRKPKATVAPTPDLALHELSPSLSDASTV